MSGICTTLTKSFPITPTSSRLNSLRSGISRHHSGGPGILLSTFLQQANPFCLLSCVDNKIWGLHRNLYRKILQGHRQKLDFFFDYCRKGLHVALVMQTAYLPFPSSQSCPALPVTDGHARRAHAHPGLLFPSALGFNRHSELAPWAWCNSPWMTEPGVKTLYSWELCPAFQPEDPLLQPLHRQTLAKGQTKESENFVQIQQEGAEAQGRTGLSQSQLPRPAMNWGCHPRPSTA